MVCVQKPRFRSTTTPARAQVHSNNKQTAIEKERKPHWSSSNSVIVLLLHLVLIVMIFETERFDESHSEKRAKEKESATTMSLLRFLLVAQAAAGAAASALGYACPFAPLPHRLDAPSALGVRAETHFQGEFLVRDTPLLRCSLFSCCYRLSSFLFSFPLFMNISSCLAFFFFFFFFFWFLFVCFWIRDAVFLGFLLPKSHFLKALSHLYIVSLPPFYSTGRLRNPVAQNRIQRVHHQVHATAFASAYNRTHRLLRYLYLFCKYVSALSLRLRLCIRFSLFGVLGESSTCAKPPHQRGARVRGAARV